MSKMGEEYNKRLEEVSHELFLSLKELLGWAENSFTDDTLEWVDGNDPAIIRAKKIIAKVEEL